MATLHRADSADYLFVLGCERSGTTAMLTLLNSDQRIVIGRERFKFVCSELSREHFLPERFFRPLPEETNVAMPDFYSELLERWRSGGVRYIGDKNPRYYEHLEHLDEVFPDGRFIFLIRDLFRVASSYQVRARNSEDTAWPAHKDFRRAARDWNASLSLLRKFVRRCGQDRVFVVEYELFFSARTAYLDHLYDFLDMEPTRSAEAKLKELSHGWQKVREKPLCLTPEMVAEVERLRDRFLEIWALQRCPRL